MAFKVQLQPSGVIYSSENKLLEDALTQNIVLEHSCKTGTCGVCRAEIIEGIVENEVGELVTTGHILTCCSKAKSDISLIANYYPELAEIKSQTVPCKVSRVENITDDILVIHFRFPPAIKFNYLAGQYIDLSYQGIRRSYSIANSKNNLNEIELHIRKVQDGKMSNLLFSSLKENQLMRMEGPKGTFFVRNNNKTLVFISTGTGIAPVKAMVEDLVQSGDTREIFIYWGMKYRSELYEKRLEKLSNEYKHIHYLPVLSREDDWQWHKGHVQSAVLKDFTTLDNLDIYACGSIEMINEAKELFIENGLSSNAFYSDAFTPAK
ncbi:FAD-binding oxidoreductase [Shewanella dokdonensis]|uniref:FAD-binding oxidoreductase n=2 Tax=Shewanella dokdonensis TaxID=712036 RepID=UPI00201081EE|nr:FAD-binding oxidoreductase [Shewanella dokdonensis]MCL1073903.1 FAD-binding oxidoreductase [Shewanella dokdonensis]